MDPQKRVISGCLRVRGVRDDGAVDAPLGKEVWERLVIDVGEDAALASLDDVSKVSHSLNSACVLPRQEQSDHSQSNTKPSCNILFSPASSRANHACITENRAKP